MIFKLALRRLLRSPLYAGGLIALLALGIGSATALLTLVDAICFRTLDAPHPEQLVRFAQLASVPRPQTEFPRLFFDALRDRSTDFSSVAAQLDEEVVLSKPAPSAQIHVHLVTPQFFSMFAVPALYGRTLLPADENNSSESPPAVLCYPFWKSRFNADPRALGQTISLNGHPFVVVGVMPPAFTGISADTTPEVRVPFRALPLLASNPAEIVNPFLTIAARLKPGVPLAAAQASTLAIWRPAIAAYWTQQARSGDWAKQNLADDLRLGIQVVSNARGASMLRDRYGVGWILLGVFALILVVLLCANLATIMLARNAADAGGIAVRLALGASRAHVLRLLLSESASLAAVGGAAGIVLGYLLIPFLLAALPPLRDFTTSHLSIALFVGHDARPSLIGILLTAGAFLGFGLAPALHSSRLPLTAGLKSRHVSQRMGAQRRLLALQIAICTVLLGCSGLLVRTLAQLRTLDPGFDAARIVSFTVNPGLVGYTPDQANRLRQQLTTRVAQLPGVDSVATSRIPLMRGSGLKMTVAPVGTTVSADEPLNVSFDSVSANYFQAMGIRLIEGRTFLETPQARADKVSDAVVNQAFVRRFFPAVDPLRRHFGPRGDDGFVIVGVVTDSKFRSLREPLLPVMYADDSFPANDRVVLYVRSATRPVALIEPVRKVFSALDPQLPVSDAETLTQELDASVAAERLNARLASAFALFAAILAGLGLYGLMALVVTQKRRTLAIHLAVGAPRASLAGLVLREFVAAIALGAAAGLLAVLFLASSIRSLLYGVPPVGPVSILTPACGVALVALLASLGPLLTAARVDPTAALHDE
jgi:predicted permease